MEELILVAAIFTAGSGVGAFVYAKLRNPETVIERVEVPTEAECKRCAFLEDEIFNLKHDLAISGGRLAALSRLVKRPKRAAEFRAPDDPALRAYDASGRKHRDVADQYSLLKDRRRRG